MRIRSALGWELLEAMQRDAALSSIPTAVVSAAREPGRIPKSIVTLAKPVNLLELRRFLEGVTAS